MQPKVKNYHGGATTSGPDATHPPAICQNSGGGGGAEGAVWGRGRLEGVGGGGFGRGGGGVPKVGGPARDPLLPHAYLLPHATSWGDVCLGVWGYGGMNAIIALAVLAGKKVLRVAVLAQSWSVTDTGCPRPGSSSQCSRLAVLPPSPLPPPPSPLPPPPSPLVPPPLVPHAPGLVCEKNS